MFGEGSEPVSGYRLLDRIGQGAFGEVWRARGPGDTLAALKLISLSGKNGLTEWRSLERVKKIRHPNLLPVFAFWVLDQYGQVVDLEHQHPPWRNDQAAIEGTVAPDSRRLSMLVIAMLAADKSLQDRLDECRGAGLAGIGLDELLDYLEDAAKGIDFLNSPRHDFGSGPVAIQHCDIKPQNILLVGTAAVVCDFGLAKVLGQRQTTKALAGSPAYMAPECIDGHTPSATTDQYSLALSYYELRTGRLPFPDDYSFAAVLNAHIRGQLDLSGVPQAEEAVLRQAVSIDPAGRFSSSLEMVRQLRAAQNAGGRRRVAVRKPSPATHVAQRSTLPATRASQSGTSRTPLRRAAPSIVIASVLIPALLVALWVAWLNLGQPGRSPQARRAVDRTTEQPADPQPQLANVSVRSPASAERLGPSPERIATADSGQDASRAVRGSPDPAHHDTDAPPEKRPVNHDGANQHVYQFFLQQGIQQLDEHRYDAALLSFDQAIRLKPDVGDAYYHRGRTHFVNWDYDRAIADLNMALTLNAEWTEAYVERGKAHLYKLDYPAAIEDFTRAIQRSPTHAEAYLCRGFALLNERRRAESQSDMERALALLNQAIQSDPNDYRAYAQRGVLHAYQGRHEAGFADFQQALRLKPDSIEVLENRAHVAALLLNDYDQGIADYSRVILLRPDSPKAYADRATAYRTKGDYEKAVADYSTAIRIRPAAGSAYSGRGITYVLMKQYDQAIADLTEAVRLNPHDVAALEWRKRAFDGRGETDTARVSAQQTVAVQDEIVQQSPDSVESYRARAAAHAEAGDHQRAIQDYSEVIRRDPQDPYAYFGRGLAYYELKQHQQAIADFDAAIRQLPDSAPFYYLRALAYEALGQSDKAQADYAKSAELQRASEAGKQK